VMDASHPAIKTDRAPVWSTAQAIAAVALTLSFFVLFWVMTRIAFAGSRPWRSVGLGLAVRAHPYAALAAGYVALFGMSYGWNTATSWTAAVACAMFAWLAVRVVAAATKDVSENPGGIIIPARLKWWLATRFRNPRDVHYANLLVVNSLVICPALIGVLVAPVLSLFTVMTYFLVASFMGLLQESLIHSDVHNHFFKWKHLKTREERLAFRSLNLYLKCVIPFISGRFPYHYTVEHGMIHHVENNGLNDVQSTVWYDRKSFIDYSRFALRQALQVSTGNDWYQYLAKRRMKKAVGILIRGQMLRYGALGLIALYNVPAAILLLLHPFWAAVPRATSIFLWHGLVDISDPENPYTNSINIAAGPDGIHAWHVEHHIQPNDHWSNMRTNAERDRESYEREGTITFIPHPQLRRLFLKAMWTRRFDLLATMCIPTCAPQRDRVVLARLLAERTEPLVPIAHGRRYRLFDDWLGRTVSKRLLRARFPVESRQTGRVPLPTSNVRYIEG
jgi:hypothetical protein